MSARCSIGSTWLIFTILYPLIIVLIAGAVEVGARFGQRSRRVDDGAPDIATLTSAVLGLLALLLLAGAVTL
jgi:hypothetical protein